MAESMQFLSENRLNECQILGRFGLLITESKPNFGFPHIPTYTVIVFCLHPCLYLLVS